MNYTAYQRLDGENTGASNPCEGFSKKENLRSRTPRSAGNLTFRSPFGMRLASLATSAHPNPMSERTQTHTPSDLMAIWQDIQKSRVNFTKEQKLQTFVDAGILTPKGNPTKPYRGVFRKIPAAKG